MVKLMHRWLLFSECTIFPGFKRLMACPTAGRNWKIRLEFLPGIPDSMNPWRLHNGISSWNKEYMFKHQKSPRFIGVLSSAASVATGAVDLQCLNICGILRSTTVATLRKLSRWTCLCRDAQVLEKKTELGRVVEYWDLWNLSLQVLYCS